MNDAIVGFGELLIRLYAPGAEALLQTPQLKVCFGGAEANVMVSLARMGHSARLVSIVPDNALGRAARDEFRRYGVDVSGIIDGPGRMGLYFLTPGAIRRAPDILYDRAGSSFALAAPELINWKAQFKGAGWFHLSGVTAAIGQGSADAAIRAAKAARAAGLTVSFDCNYRSKLWEAWSGDGSGILRELLGCADLLFGDHRDIALILGRSFDSDIDKARAAAAQVVFTEFPNIRRMACTFRTQHSVDHHDLSGFMFAPDGAWTTPALPLWPIVDRIGGGDAFAAGVIHGLARGWDDQKALDFGVAAAGVKHAIPGDFNVVTEAEVLAALSEDGVGVRR